MLDLRVYRAAFVPAVLALVVAAFALAERPARPIGDHARARRVRRHARVRDAPRARPTLPDRRRRRRPATRRWPRRACATSCATAAIRGRRRGASSAQTIDGERDADDGRRRARRASTNRRIVVLAHRDAARARVDARRCRAPPRCSSSRASYGGRALRQTLVLVSTSGGSGGIAGARELADASRRARSTR